MVDTKDRSFLKFLSNEFNILDTIESGDVFNASGNYSVLENWLEKNKRDSYDPNDRFVVLHFENDYYINMEYGIFVNNFIRLWQHYNIPFYTLIFYTNHIGISKEIFRALEYNDPEDRPFVFETIVNKINHPHTGYIKHDISIEDIDHHLLYLNAGTTEKTNALRPHRLAFYNEIKDLYPKHLVCSAYKTK